MQVHIYADIVFFINLIMNFLIFWIVSKLIKEKVKVYKIFTGAFMGAALYCIMIFMPMFRGVYNFFSVILILVTSLIITFGVANIKKLTKLVIYSHIVAFMVGGMGIAIYYYANTKNIFNNITTFGSDYFSFKILIISISISYITIKLSALYLQKVLIMKQSFYKVKIFNGDASIDILAMVDTGNSLLDPLSKFPVIIAEFKSIKNFLPSSIQILFYEKRENDLYNVINNLSKTEMDTKIRVIPFKSIGKKDGILIGFKPDKVEITYKETTLKTTNVVIGICNLNLSSSGQYQGLLNPALLEN